MSDALAPDPAAVEYPGSDGRPMAETPLHAQRMMETAYALQTRYRDRRDVFVGFNNMVYDEPGNPRRHLSPDVFVAFGVADRDRDVYKLWEEQTPAFVLEITSKTTRAEDERKKARYAGWGVRDYFMYDPRGEYLKPALQGYRLAGCEYEPLGERVLPNGRRGILACEIGLGLWLDGGVLRLHDGSTGRDLHTPDDERRARQTAEAKQKEARAEGLAEGRQEGREAGRRDERMSLLEGLLGARGIRVTPRLLARADRIAALPQDTVLAAALESADLDDFLRRLRS